MASIVDEIANDDDRDPGDEIQDLGRSGSKITITGGTSASVDDADADPANELQDISLNGNALSISGGNTLTLDNLSVVTTMFSSSPGETAQSVAIDGADEFTAEVLDQCFTPGYTAGSGEQAIIHASLFFDAGSVTVAAPLAG